ncbi:MAG: hypothetical protein ACTHMM_07205 [Agriterribacter sp.]
MKKFLILIVLFSSCAPQLVPLKNTYNAQAFEQPINADFETVWNKTVETVAKKGSTIKMIDKDNGLIVAQNNYAPITSEDKDARLVDSTAWAVASKLYRPGSRKYFYASEGTLEWNIHVKRAADNATVINISLVDAATVTSIHSPGYTTKQPVKPFKAKAVTTGVLEKQIAEEIRRR